MMALRNPATPISHELEARIHKHRAEKAKRRFDRPDPEQELGALLREQIGFAALEATYEEYRQNKYSWLEDEDTPAHGG
jgi:hypothetical protein